MFVTSHKKTIDDVRHFVVVYDVESGTADVKVFDSANFDRALELFRELELEQHHNLAVEQRQRVLLFSADSEEILHFTHSHYFRDKADRPESESWDESLVAIA